MTDPLNSLSKTQIAIAYIQHQIFAETTTVKDKYERNNRLYIDLYKLHKRQAKECERRLLQ